MLTDPVAPVPATPESKTLFTVIVVAVPGVAVADTPVGDAVALAPTVTLPN